MSDRVPQPAVVATLAFAVPRRGVRTLAIGIELLIGIPAFPAGVGLIRDGLGLRESWISHSLLPDYTIPGVLLIVLIGGGMTAAAIASLRRPELTAPAALAVGLLQLAWLAIETLILGWRGAQQLVLLGLIGALAIVLVAIGLSALALAVRRSGAAGAGAVVPPRTQGPVRV